MDEWKKLKKKNYKKDVQMQYGAGVLDFDPKGMDDFNPGDFKSYDEYLEIQWKSLKSSRDYFERCYYELWDYSFKGQVERITDTSILFKRILIEGMCSDGIGFEGKEDHVWMDKVGFENCKVGDCVAFSAEVYRYIKKSNGKLLDYGLRDPEDIRVIQSYEIPTDEDLINQQIDQLICETCLFTNHCYMGNCVANQKHIEETKKFLKELEPGRFTTNTVLAAYEISGQVFTQVTGGKLDKNNPNYEIQKRILTEANKRNAGCIWPLEKSLMALLMPERPRIYV